MIGIFVAVALSIAVGVGRERQGLRQGLGIRDKAPRRDLGATYRANCSNWFRYAQFCAVGHAIVVAIGVHRARQAIAIGIKQRVGLGAVGHTIVVAVHVLRRGTRPKFLVVRQTIAVRIRQIQRRTRRRIRVALARIHTPIAIDVFEPVALPIAVAIGPQRRSPRQGV